MFDVARSLQRYCQNTRSLEVITVLIYSRPHQVCTVTSSYYVGNILLTYVQTNHNYGIFFFGGTIMVTATVELLEKYTYLDSFPQEKHELIEKLINQVSGF
jgi:hypothetical protein